MDAYILISGILTFIVYFVVKIIVFRLINPDKVFQWLFLVYLLIAGVSIMINTVLILSVIMLSLFDAISMSIVSCLIYSSLAFFYVLAIFGITVTSIRINLL